ncbi:MAG: hypothetical protein IJJ23_12190 [Clostridia bacterium]|nr:hypothetical protein [Clostridia bacterium]
MDNKTIKQWTPDVHDMVLAREKFLTEGDGFSGEYFQLRDYYLKAVYARLNLTTGLAELEEAISQDDLAIAHRTEPENVYQEYAAFGFKYFYLRNDVAIERLTSAQLDELSEFVSSGAPCESEAVQDFVARTLETVIRSSPELESDAIEIIYEDDGRSAPNNALVLGLSFQPDYDENGNLRDYEQNARKNMFLDAMTADLEPRLSEAFGLPVRIFRY